MATAVNKLRERIALRMSEAMKGELDADLKEAFQNWIDTAKDAAGSRESSAKLVQVLTGRKDNLSKELLALKQYFVKKSVWIFGGDGWAYDIGFGGLDHVLASGEDVNVLVMDTEVYSNTGGQASKSTPMGAVAKFATSGKKVKKKDLGAMMMSYGYIYVAQVAMGANQNQFFKALKEAEEFKGPSIIIAYAPCINHGLHIGMGKTQYEEKLAVESGYWQMYRYNPALEEEGKNPFQLDSKEPDWSKFKSFIGSEVRFSSLKKTFPDQAKFLGKLAEDNAKWRYNYYKRLEAMDYSEK